MIDIESCFIRLLCILRSFGLRGLVYVRLKRWMSDLDSEDINKPVSNHDGDMP